MFLHRDAGVDAVAGILHNPSEMLILSVFTLAAGLAMVLAHNIWSGSALAVVVTVVGWLMLLKGLFSLYLLPEVEADCILRCLRHPQLFYVCMAPSILLGIYLTYGGFTSKSHS
jgi:vacuolar-type H+-ATPase subunit I/STV1